MDVCPTITLEAYEQLAIHAERRLHDPRRALERANQGMNELRKLQRAGEVSPSAIGRMRYRLYERIARLEKKIGRDLLI